MTYLLDTDTLSNLVRPAPAPLLVRRLATVEPSEQATSSITVGELLYGAHRRSVRSGELIERIERDLLWHLPVLPFDEDAARVYGSLRVKLERQGTPIGDTDTRIASIALARGMVVVTGNVRHFERVPDLLVENWLA